MKLGNHLVPIIFTILEYCLSPIFSMLLDWRRTGPIKDGIFLFWASSDNKTCLQLGWLGVQVLTGLKNQPSQCRERLGLNFVKGDSTVWLLSTHRAIPGKASHQSPLEPTCFGYQIMGSPNQWCLRLCSPPLLSVLQTLACDCRLFFPPNPERAIWCQLPADTQWDLQEEQGEGSPWPTV